MSADVKQVTLTGTAAAEFGPRPEKKERVRRKGGDSQAQTQAAKPPSAPSVPSSALPPPSSASAPAPPVPPAPSVPVLAPPAPPAPAAPAATEGGAKVIKVELKKRATAKRVHLQPKNARVKKVGPSASSASGSPQTKKARKVTLAVSALHKRVSRAKKMTRKVKEMSLPQLREHLIQKKLIKANSKAPEAILRQIAADAQIVAGKAL